MRTIKDKHERQEAKTACQYVTMSGTFSERRVDGLLIHSGLIAIDLDGLDDVEEAKSLLCADPHVYACFVSISGNGLCVVVKINPERHLDAFKGLQEYIYTEYRYVVDTTGKDVSRARYVSFDPYLFLNEQSKKFAKYPKKEKPQGQIKEVVFVQTDFDHIIEQIVSRQVDITGRYHQWLKCCFALCDKLGEGGRNYFHVISQFSSLYNTKLADKQYDNCLKAGKSGITIASFYYLCKEHGLSITSEVTRKIAQVATLAKKGGRDKESVIKLLAEQEGIAPLEAQGVVDQVFDDGAQATEDESPVEQARIWLMQNHELRYNEVTGLLEDAGVALTDRAETSIELAIKNAFPKMDFSIITKTIRSNSVPGYHPIKDFFTRYEGRYKAGCINTLLSALQGPQGQDYIQFFGHKWIVGMVAGVFGRVNPLFWCLCGEKMGTGKTRFFKDLLPPELKGYQTVKSLADMSTEAARRDLEIAMSRYLLIYDDEMSGKSKRDEKKIKSLLSMEDSTHRAAFGRNEERRQRLCAFGGTSNDLRVIGWDVDNRRHVPVEVQHIDYKVLNSVDRVDLLMEAYALYRSGFDFEVLGDDIDKLNAGLDPYKQINAEAELVSQRFRPGIAPEASFMTLTDVKRFLEVGGKEQYSPAKLAAALRDIGADYVMRKIGTQVLRGFWVVAV